MHATPKLLVYFLFLIGLCIHTHAQPTEQAVKVVVAPDHDDWSYKSGEKINFRITVLQNGNAVKNVKVKYEAGPEKMEPVVKDSLILKNGTHSVEGLSLKKPGFVRCIVTAFVDGKMYRGLATAGIDPLKIEPTVENPTDFVQFWETAKSEAAKIPMDTRMTLLPEKCTETVDVFHVSFQNYRMGSRMYGILCVPKKPGKYPAMLKVPGAGVRAYNGDVNLAQKGVITFEIGIHGIPVTMEPPVYTDLGSSALNQYYTFNLDNRDRYYYKRVYLGCVRANDFIFSLPQFDGNLAVTGGSQGGALSIITAALDQRVKFLASYYPALSDITGYLHGRAGGWPHLLDRNNSKFHNTPGKLETIKYYDVVNFARIIKVPGYYSWGFNDETCPPTSMYAAYNVIRAPRELYLALETGHWTYPEQREKVDQWILKMFGK